MNLETSHKFLAEKYDALLVGIQEQKKHKKDSSDRIDGETQKFDKEEITSTAV